LVVILDEEFRGGEHKSIVTTILIEMNVVVYLYRSFSSYITSFRKL
jgi:hypothetical protein